MVFHTDNVNFTRKSSFYKCIITRAAIPIGCCMCIISSVSLFLSLKPLRKHHKTNNDVSSFCTVYHDGIHLHLKFKYSVIVAFEWIWLIDWDIEIENAMAKLWKKPENMRTMVGYDIEYGFTFMCIIQTMAICYELHTHYTHMYPSSIVTLLLSCVAHTHTHSLTKSVRIVQSSVSYK